MSFKDFIIYGAGISGACLLLYGFCCSVKDHFRDRREDMRQARAIRLGRMAHAEDYTIEPLSEEQLEDLEDWSLMVETSGDPSWVEDGIELLSLHATWAQRPGDELAA